MVGTSDLTGKVIIPEYPDPTKTDETKSIIVLMPQVLHKIILSPIIH